MHAAIAQQSMQCDFRRAVETHRKNAGADPGRGVAGHVVVGPGSGPHASRQDRIEDDRNGAGQADLTPMGVPAEHQIEPGMRGLPIDLRGMRQEDGKFANRDTGSRLFDVVHPVIVSIVDADEMDMIPAPLDYLRLVEQPDRDQLQVLEVESCPGGLLLAVAMPEQAQQLSQVLVGGASLAGLRGAADRRPQRLCAVAPRALRLAEVDRRQLIQRWQARRAAPAELDYPIDAASLLSILNARRNDLEIPAIKIQAIIADVLTALQDFPNCLLARMSGSGATCFGLFGSVGAAQDAARELSSAHPGWWVNATVLG